MKVLRSLLVLFAVLCGFGVSVIDVRAQTITPGGGGGGTPGGSSGQCQYNNAGAFAGTSGCTSTATNVTFPSQFTSTSNANGTPWYLDAKANDPDVALWSLNYTKNTGVNLPASSKADTVFNLGYNFNLGGNSSRQDTTKPAFGITWESLYYQGGVGPQPLSEFHIKFIGTDGVEHRLFTVAPNQDGSTSGSSYTSMQSPLGAYFADWSGTNKIFFDWSNAHLELISNMGIKLNANGAKITQKLADGTTDANLPYINASNQLKLEQPVYLLTGNDSNGNVLNIQQQGTPAVESSAVVVTYAAAASYGDMRAQTWTGSTSGVGSLKFRNNSASGSGRALFTMGKDSGTADSGYVLVSPTSSWGMYISKTNSDDFFIDSDANQFVNDPSIAAVRISKATNSMTLIAPLREAHIVHVSGLATCNAGALGTWDTVDDATAPTYRGTLTGGGAVKVPVWCNGTAWESH